MDPARSAGLPSISEFRRNLEASFAVTAADEEARTRTITALLVVFIPILLIQLAIVLTFNHELWPLALTIIGLGAALLAALRGRGHLSGWLALLALLANPIICIVINPLADNMLAIYLIQTTFAALMIGLMVLRPRAYRLFVILIFVIMLLTGYFVEAGTADAALVLPFTIIVLLELVSVALVVVIFRATEVNQRRRAQADLQRDRERYRIVSTLVGDVIYSMRVEPGPTFVLDWMSGRGTFADFTNLPLEGAFDPAAFIHSDDLEGVRELLQSALRGGSASTEARMVAPDGHIRWTRALAYGAMDETSGRVTEIYGVIEDIHDRKLAEESLRKERSRYEELVNSIDGVVYEIDTETRETLFISQQVEHMLGYSQQDFVDNPMLWIERVHPEDIAATIDFTKRKIGQYESYELGYRMLSASGQTVWVRDIASIITRPGQAASVRGLAINETASHEAQQAEREQRRLREALQTTIAAISKTLNLDDVADRILASLQDAIPCDVSEIMFVDAGLVRIFRARDFAGISDIHSALNAALPIADTPNLREMVETGQPKLIDDVRADPDWIVYFDAPWIVSVAGVPIRLDDETIGFLNLISSHPRAFTPEHAEYLRMFADQIAIAVRNARLYDQVRRNATLLARQVKERTAELELERQRLSVMLDSTADGIYYTEGRVIHYVNPAFCAMLGYKADELIGQPVDILLPSVKPEDRAAEHLIHETLARDGVWRGERQIRRRDGSLLEGGLTVSSTQPDNPGTGRLVVLVRDISREKALQLQQSNLIAYASHELRTPITNLKTRLYLLRRRPELLNEHIEVLEEVAERMRRLVEDLLDLTRMERGVSVLQRRVTDVVALVQGIYRLQLPEADRQSLHLGVSLPGAPVYANIDPERITQVITNLIANAINYTPSGGTVRLSVVTSPDRNHVLVRVMDSGIGISAEDLPFIFQPFYRVVSNVEGAGLGLSIAREIIELHGGEIEVKSQIRRGSTFSVHLPAINAPVHVSET